MLAQMRKELVGAMKTGDRARTGMLKELVSDVTYAQKTNRPIRTDMELYAHLQSGIDKRAAAAEEFARHSRPDLAEKEVRQAGLLREYMDRIPVMERGEIARVVQEVKGASTPPLALLLRQVGERVGDRAPRRTLVEVCKSMLDASTARDR